MVLFAIEPKEKSMLLLLFNASKHISLRPFVNIQPPLSLTGFLSGFTVSFLTSQPCFLGDCSEIQTPLMSMELGLQFQYFFSQPVCDAV